MTESQLTLFAEDSPARISPSLEDRPALKLNAPDYGRSVPVLLGSFDPDTPSLRTSQTCLLESEESGLSEFSGTFPRSGMMCSGTVYQLPNLARTITEIGSGLLPTPTTANASGNAQGPKNATLPWAVRHIWPTPTTMDHLPPKSEKALLKEATEIRPGRSQPQNLRDCVQPQSMRMWPTPKSSMSGPDFARANREGSGSDDLVTTVAKTMLPTPTATDATNSQGPNSKQKGLSTMARHNMWPTPRASEYKDSGPVGSKSHSHMHSKDYLCAVVKQEDSPTGKLNPLWVEWLMGFPPEHTALKPSETQ